MRAYSNQPAKLYAPAKTHKLNDLNVITIQNLNLRPIADQTATATHHKSNLSISKTITRI